jgi:hypothetical protein
MGHFAMKTLSRRVRRLENQFALAISARPKPSVPSDSSGREWIIQKLNEWGIVRDPKESLAETTARALGLTSIQLRCYLQNRAAGLK